MLPSNLNYILGIDGNLSIRIMLKNKEVFNLYTIHQSKVVITVNGIFYLKKFISSLDTE
jgi:hypothetical protein